MYFLTKEKLKCNINKQKIFITIFDNKNTLFYKIIKFSINLLKKLNKKIVGITVLKVYLNKDNIYNPYE